VFLKDLRAGGSIPLSVHVFNITYSDVKYWECFVWHISWLCWRA